MVSLDGALVLFDSRKQNISRGMNVLLASDKREQTSEDFSASLGCVGAETSIDYLHYSSPSPHNH